MSRLPPFDALIAFEATARLGSMTRAATDLFLTQSAISHRIRRLETFMGVQLFERGTAGLIPSAPGQAILDRMPSVLDALAELRTRCLAAAAPMRLRVGVGAALADNWLVRRLPQFLTLRMRRLSAPRILTSESCGLARRMLVPPLPRGRCFANPSFRSVRRHCCQPTRWPWVPQCCNICRC
jgi:DNA-binding transcriptional LysR family regulator